MATTQDRRSSGEGVPVTHPPAECLARDVMTAPVVCVSAADTVRVLLEAMHRTGVRHVVVADKGRCAGIVDDRRLILEWAVGTVGANARTAADLLPHDGHSVRLDTPVRTVAAILIEDSRGAVPVLDEEGRPAGIVTTRDLLRCLLPPSGDGHASGSQ